jgi:hypothetical protein
VPARPCAAISTEWPNSRPSVLHSDNRFADKTSAHAGVKGITSSREAAGSKSYPFRPVRPRRRAASSDMQTKKPQISGMKISLLQGGFQGTVELVNSLMPSAPGSRCSCHIVPSLPRQKIDLFLVIHLPLQLSGLAAAVVCVVPQEGFEPPTPSLRLMVWLGHDSSSCSNTYLVHHSHNPHRDLGCHIAMPRGVGLPQGPAHPF